MPVPNDATNCALTNEFTRSWDKIEYEESPPTVTIKRKFSDTGTLDVISKFAGHIVSSRQLKVVVCGYQNDSNNLFAEAKTPEAFFFNTPGKKTFTVQPIERFDSQAADCADKFDYEFVNSLNESLKTGTSWSEQYDSASKVLTFSGVQPSYNGQTKSYTYRLLWKDGSVFIAEKTGSVKFEQCSDYKLKSPSVANEAIINKSPWNLYLTSHVPASLAKFEAKPYRL